ncbi:MAG TPA: CheR family methyltransferase [Kofleriaceae bacterium]|nr:CheR family methyltransferase [Kofleriaceae bacterium]
MQPADVELGLLLDAIYRAYHYDFRAYAEASLRRRIQTALGHFQCPTISRLQERILREPAVFGELLRFLTVQVSDMFRDSIYFRALRDIAVPYLTTYASLKVWVAGCATGEEAYSLAILLHEAGLLERTQIYATDINPESLRTARAGIYDASRCARFGESYLAAGGRASLADYYTVAYDAAVMDRRLKQAIVFSDHSLATDSVFSEVQLVSCRNVLIYFQKELQDRALGLLADSLSRRGFLGLGTKESLRFSPLAATFTECAPDARLYRKL